MAWYDFLTGTNPQLQQLQRFNPQQQNSLNQVLGMATGGLQNLNKPFDFAPIEQQARSGFAQKTVPTLAERFTGMNSALSSPAFASQLSQAGAGLEESLAALKSQVGLQDMNRQQSLLLNLLQAGLQPQYENVVQQREPGLLENTFGGLAGGLGGGLLSLLLSSLLGGNQKNSQPQQQQPYRMASNFSSLSTPPGLINPTSGLQSLMGGF